MRLEDCVECGLCVSACPITGTDPDYLGPAVLGAAWRVVAEPRGLDAISVLDGVDDHQGCWRCHLSFACSEVCPTGADPAGGIMALRGALTRRHLGLGHGGGRDGAAPDPDRRPGGGDPMSAPSGTSGPDAAGCAAGWRIPEVARRRGRSWPTGSRR